MRTDTVARRHRMTQTFSSLHYERDFVFFAQVAGTGLAKLLSADSGRDAGHDANTLSLIIMLALSRQFAAMRHQTMHDATDEGYGEHGAPYPGNTNDAECFPPDTDTDTTDGSADLSDNSASTTLLKKNPLPSRLAPLADSDPHGNEVVV